MGKNKKYKYLIGEKFLINKNGENKIIFLMKNVKKDRFVKFVTLDENGKRIFGEPMLMEYDRFENSIVKKL